MKIDANRIRAFILIAALLAVTVTGAPAWAQENATPAEGEEVADAVESSVVEPEDSVEPDDNEIVIIQAEPDVEVIPELATPRKCYETYREAMQAGNLIAASDCLDLSGISSLIRSEEGQNRARKLGEIITYSPETLNLESLPNDPVGPSVTLLEREEGDLVIGLGMDGAWRFTEETVGAIPVIYETMELGGEFDVTNLAIPEEEQLTTVQDTTGFGVRQTLTAEWKQRWLFLENWQWVFLAVILVLGYLLDIFVPRLLGWLLGLWFSKTHLKENKELLLNTSRPFGFLAMSAFLWFAFGRAGLDEGLLLVLLTAAKFMTTFGIVWCAYRAVDIVSSFIEHAAKETESRMDDQLAPFVRKALKVVVTIFGVVFIASNIDINITSLVAGLGIGGIAVALAAKDTLENLFGSLTVLVDRPFQVGDWVVIGDAEGTVEELGFRSTRIRTFYNSVVTVPNAVLMRTNVDNLGVRRWRRIKVMLGLAYSTPPEKIEAFTEGIRELIRTHPYTRKDYFHCYLNQFSDSSMDVLLYCFLETPDWSTELRERHRLFMDIIRLANDLGVTFAFPTQTIHMTEEPPSAPVFPETGEIDDFVQKALVQGRNAARKIAVSELGGSDVIPDPVRFDYKIDPDSDDAEGPSKVGGDVADEG